ncbi:FUSC family protein [Bizionia sediminis]|uniref:FUSC family protein n=1 Tax=Bizionia sediminis TaxID=1737064 RepID=A0ABW5KSG6_9FLAO
MKKILTLGSLLCAVFAILLAVLPLSNFAFLPAGLGALLAGSAFYVALKQKQPTHSIKLAFLLLSIALVLASYKLLFTSLKVENTEELQQTEQQSEQEAIETLEELNLDDIEM